MKIYELSVDYRCTEVYHIEAESEQDARDKMDNIDCDPVNTTDISWEVDKVVEQNERSNNT